MNKTIEFDNITWCWHEEAGQYSFCPNPNAEPPPIYTGKRTAFLMVIWAAQCNVSQGRFKFCALIYSFT